MNTILEPNFHLEWSTVIWILLICASTTFMAWCLTSMGHELGVAKRLRTKRLVSRQMTDAFWLPKKVAPSKAQVKIYREVTQL